MLKILKLVIILEIIKIYGIVFFMINIAYGFDENFSDAALVSILSCITNNNENLTFHLITFEENTDNLDMINKEILLKNQQYKNYLVDSDKVNWKLGSLGIRNNSPATASFTNATYLKILIPNLVQEDKIIFLDSDTLVGNCLKELFEYQTKGKIIAGVSDDGVSSFLGDEEDIFGYKKNDYINAGVLLMDLEKMRSINFVSKCYSAYQKYSSQIKFNDQDLINLTLKSEKFLLPERFNTLVKFSEKQNIVNKKINSLENSILHFIGNIKPWQSWNLPSFCNIWMQYATLASTKKIELTPITKLSQMTKQGQLLHSYGDYHAASLAKSRAINILIEQLNKSSKA